jgi:transglutaminase-like putative cysteine protease
MRLSVHHATRFDFDQPSGHSIHDVRLTPKPAAGQRIVSWRIDGPGKRSEWLDGHGNQVTPFWLRNSTLTRHDASFDPLIEGLAEQAADPAQRVAVLHEVMKRVGERVAYKTGVSTVETTALEALVRGAGVAQDDAHVFIACCRRLGVPARYVSGYLRNDDPDLHVGRTSHSWAEAWVPGLEWVGFDPANNMSPRGDSLRVAIGLDYRDAAPVSGRRVGFGDATMSVDAEVTLVG